MINFFSFSKKNTDAQSPKMTLKQTIQQLSPNNEESILNFAKILSDYSDHSDWVAIPMEDISTNEVALFEELGKIYVGMYSDIPSKRFSIVETDINKLFHIVFTMDNIAGIVIDPESTQLYLERDFLRKCLAYCEYQKYLPEADDIIKMAKYMQEEASKVGIFHVARRSDGSIEPVISAYLDPSDLETIQGLLNTSHVQSDYVSHYDDHYLFMFDGNSAKPYPSVMIWKYRLDGIHNTFIDVEQEDLKAVDFAVRNYLN